MKQVLLIATLAICSLFAKAQDGKWQVDFPYPSDSSLSIHVFKNSRGVEVVADSSLSLKIEIKEIMGDLWFAERFNTHVFAPTPTAPGVYFVTITDMKKHVQFTKRLMVN